MHLFSLLWILSTFVAGEEITVCQSHSMEISCEKGNVLVFESAEYGRQDDVTCLSQKGSSANNRCSVPNAVGYLNELCFRKSDCNLNIERIFSPEKCPGVSAYLKAEYSCVQESDIHTVCDSYYIEKESGYIISPNYPNLYNPRQKCTSEIKQTKGVKTRLTLLDLEVEARTTTGCYDWLTFSELNVPSERFDYCGTLQSNKEPTILTFKEPLVMFKPDQLHNYRGFLIKFEAVANPEEQQKLAPEETAEGDETDHKIEQLKKSLAKLELQKKKTAYASQRGRIPRQRSKMSDVKNYQEETKKKQQELEREALKQQEIEKTKDLEKEKRETEQEIEKMKQLEKEKIEKEQEQKLQKLERERKEQEEMIRKKQEDEDIMREFEAKQLAKLRGNAWGKPQIQQEQNQAKKDSFGNGCVKEMVPLPENSYILTYKEGKKVQIECAEGYRMDDEDNGLLVCHKDNWAGQTGKCIPINCEEPKSPEHGEVIYQKPTIGSTIEYICHKGYVLVGERTLTCQSDGQWSGYTPFCTRSGTRSLSLIGEIVVAVILTVLFLFFKKRLPRFVGRFVISIGKTRNV